MGVKHSYCELSYFHVTKLSRGKGVGRELFSAVKKVAKGMERDKLYIGAHPSVETISFYKSMGCTLAEEMNQEIYLREPLDIQLECLL
ncbi:GNAT family N-acetyltransferase [Bacillus coahuilensis]|uniref:GNAT family N-acetyltransferase n=1 Tax=Bacillus coahuilensis TaxID=408580 RepID=UPI0001850ECB|nr:GNAT family N-acetyltransferase [Bacillus coahuilensis]